MINSIESSIIAYFDNRLSDAERVDLLRQVNESGDARRLFRQHEVLRSLVQRAQATAAVGSVTENTLLSKISPWMNDHPVQPRFFQTFTPGRAFVAGLAASAIVFLGLFFGNTILNGSDKFNSQKILSRPIQSLSTPSDNQINIAGEEIAAVVPKKQAHVYKSVTLSVPIPSSIEPPSNSPASIKPTALLSCNIPAQSDVHISNSLSQLTGIHNLNTVSNDASGLWDKIRLSLQADSPPVNDHHFPGLAGGTASLGYFISPSDIISAGFNYHASRLLPPSIESTAQSDDDKHDHFVYLWSAGLAIEHQIMAYDGRLIFAGSIGAGLMNYGNYESADISAMTPIGGNLLTGIGVSISHEHFSTSSWPVQDAVPSTQTSQWTNAEAAHFLTAKIYYTISYGF